MNFLSALNFGQETFTVLWEILEQKCYEAKILLNKYMQQ